MADNPFSGRGSDGNLTNHVHSNGYARSAYGPRIGSVGKSAFSRRKQIEHNRRVIGRYQHSQIGSLPSHDKGPEDLSKHRGANPGSVPPVRPVFQRPNIQPKTFKEPPSRPFNPYS